VHVLPPQLLPPLDKQRFSLNARVCAGLGCPRTDILIRLAGGENKFTPSAKGEQSPGLLVAGRDDARHQDGPIITQTPGRPIPFDRENVLCFCLDLYAVLHVARNGSPDDPTLSFALENLEIVDINPDGLENAAECYLKAVLILGVLPKIKLALSKLVLSMKDFLTIKPTPISAAVPFNPAIENDQIKAFISVTA
jgi:hypothetical protein